MTTATDGAMLLAAILDNPGDDDRRLVYADWLEEQGKEPVRRAMMRGEYFERIEGGFVRAVCPELYDFIARNGLEVWADGSRWRLADRVGPPIRPDTEKIAFRRGFLSLVRCPLAAWQAHGPALVRAHPIERVEIPGKEPDHEEDNRWYWYVGTSDYPDCLPRRIFDLMEGFVNDPFINHEKIYLTRQAALDALSAACLAWAKLPEDQR